MKYLIHWNAVIRNAFLKIFFVCVLLSELKKEARILCEDMHSATIAKVQQRDNNSMNLDGSGNGKK